VIDNAEFLTLFFGNVADGARPWVTSFAHAPCDSDRRDWAGWPVRRPSDIPVGAGNNFVTVSSYLPAEDGRYNRRKANFAATHAVMVDDIGTKVAESAIALPFTLEVETSPGNRQGWYRLAPACADQTVAALLIDRMIRAGLTADGKDPGMRGVTRYGRLPVGRNNKHAYVARLGAPWGQVVAAFRPEVAYSIEEIAEAFGLDLAPDLAPVRIQRTDVPAECASALDWLRALGLYVAPGSGGWHRIICPWSYDHTPGGDDTAGYAEPGPHNNFVGGFCCHHGHCFGRRNIGTLLRLIDLAQREAGRNHVPVP
jgi:hypothetical protein